MIMSFHYDIEMNLPTRFWPDSLTFLLLVFQLGLWSSIFWKNCAWELTIHYCNLRPSVGKVCLNKAAKRSPGGLLLHKTFSHFCLYATDGQQSTSIYYAFKCKATGNTDLLHFSQNVGMQHQHFKLSVKNETLLCCNHAGTSLQGQTANIAWQNYF